MCEYEIQINAVKLFNFLIILPALALSINLLICSMKSLRIQHALKAEQKNFPGEYSVLVKTSQQTDHSVEGG